MGKWHISVNNQQSGPFELQQVQQFLISGQVTADTLVWTEGMAQWAAARTIPDLATAILAAPPPANDPFSFVNQPTSYTPTGYGSSGLSCPFCHHEGRPLSKKQLSTSGWILFAVLLLFCLPLCWLPFVIDGCKDEIKSCIRCGARIG